VGPPDRPQRVSPWTVGAVVIVLTVGGMWWIVGRGSGGKATPVPTHERCQPVSTSVPAGAATASTDEWNIEVVSTRPEPSVPAGGGGTWDAAPGEVFIVVEVRFTNLHPGSESLLSTREAHMRCADGTEQTMAGFDGGRGFCRVCQADLGTDARRVRWAFIFRLKREFLRQRLQFVYGLAPPIDLTLTG
jgi:hypothetical protein